VSFLAAAVALLSSIHRYLAGKTRLRSFYTATILQSKLPTYSTFRARLNRGHLICLRLGDIDHDGEPSGTTALFLFTGTMNQTLHGLRSDTTFMDTISTPSTQTNTSQRNPQRLSALYQYHNAPEVAPAHGLEYDETVHSTCSDKYPVPQNNKDYQPPQSSKVYDNDRPPLIIFGMKLRTFLLVAALLVLVVIGAAVGGGVGGRGMHENSGNGMLPIDNENNDDGNNADASNDDNNSTNTSTR
jgi:hypothetical protein